MENKVGKKAPKHLDDDEDRKNPAYIPRKGLFFEHDLRGQTQEEEVRYVAAPGSGNAGSTCDVLGRRQQRASLFCGPAACWQHPAGTSWLLVL